jgi:acyl-phosphate glycerol 3-phosphate acyltransferase
MSILFLLITTLGAYLLGAVPFGYLVARVRGVDILAQGSGNIGATNVGRVLGRRWGLLVFLLDFAKGALPVLGASLAASAVPELAPGVLAVTAALAAFLGHLFPVYLGFRGGKGVATGVGVVAVLLPGIAVAVLLAWAALLVATRFVSVASLGAAALLLLLRLVLTPHPFGHDQLAVTLFCFLGTVLVWVRHAANLRRLMKGTENRFEETAAMLTLGKTLHVLAVGCWFGTMIFFTIMGLALVSAFEQESLKEERPLWFPRSGFYEQPRPSERFPEPLRKEQGLRAFGAAVSPLFPIYYGIQLACGAVAMLTAFAWIGRPGRIHQVRGALLLVAFVTVLGAWWLEHVVSDLRGPRNDLTDRVLTKAYLTGVKTVTPEQWDDPWWKERRTIERQREDLGVPVYTAEEEQLRARAVQEAEDARAAFGRWHGYSLIVNMLTLLLVAIAMGMAAALPSTSDARTAVSGQPAKVNGVDAGVGAGVQTTS